MKKTMFKSEYSSGVYDNSPNKKKNEKSMFNEDEEDGDYAGFSGNLMKSSSSI
jgi:hypothetical protein